LAAVGIFQANVEALVDHATLHMDRSGL
jgi:hypothetical protein